MKIFILHRHNEVINLCIRELKKKFKKIKSLYIQ